LHYRNPLFHSYARSTGESINYYNDPYDWSLH